jgi:hypothetical protein
LVAMMQKRISHGFRYGSGSREPNQYGSMRKVLWNRNHRNRNLVKVGTGTGIVKNSCGSRTLNADQDLDLHFWLISLVKHNDCQTCVTISFSLRPSGLNNV